MKNEITNARQILVGLIEQSKVTGDDRVRCKASTLQRVDDLLASIPDVKPKIPVMEDSDVGWNAALEALKAPDCWCDPELDGANPSCPTHGSGNHEPDKGGA